MYRKLGYREIVERVAHVSMTSAVFAVKALPEYTTNKGEVCSCNNNYIICYCFVNFIVGNHWCSAWFDSERIPHNCALPVWKVGSLICHCIYFVCIFSTKKILGISTLSRPEHSTAQTREMACTRDVVPQVQSRGLSRYTWMHIIIIAKFRHWSHWGSSWYAGAGRKVRVRWVGTH